MSFEAKPALQRPHGEEPQTQTWPSRRFCQVGLERPTDYLPQGVVWSLKGGSWTPRSTTFDQVLVDY